ncbi:unnamed protein product [Rotaria socialis]|uniref:C2H2-type domain-containing protein n=2 Tax=Rotaria socialis TaxID=392032 RepID=A0A820RKP1_9BILA|nr:unnamed protein product [Rotaria socialis]CAF3328250.1 unnamed protein product [Rotaria socialis]CAF3394215.1 unnamed protein product [Rotaria socialis]CAF3436992.1 unnamed protein product [Rotaria socialis]CAF4253854.1 unnamed protein product [Rotaria socialis]
MNNSKSPVTKDEKSSNGHHFSESNQSAFRRISSIKSDPTDKINEKSTKNGTSISSDDLLLNKSSMPNPFLSPLISSSSDFHSHLALLRPFLSQTLPFVPTLPPPSYWHTLPLFHPYLSSFRPSGLLPLPLSSSPSSSGASATASLQPKASTSTSTNANNKKSSSATHYHQYTITNNNVLVPSPASLMDFIRRPTTSNGDTTNAHPTSNSSKSKNLKKYKCDICSRAFSRSNTLVTHKRIHTGEKPFVCEVCDRAFRQPGNLTRHKLTHTAAKPYACEICSKAFNRASNLHAHQRTHSLMMPMMTKPTTSTNNNNNNNNGHGHGPYTCAKCHEAFEHKFELSLHIAAIHHSDIKLFQKNNEEVEVDDGEDDDDIEDEHSFDKEEDMSDDSEQNIDLLEN